MKFLSLFKIRLCATLLTVACGINFSEFAAPPPCFAQSPDYRKDKYVFKNLKKANKLIDRKDYDTALSILGKLVQLDPNTYSSSVHCAASRAFYLKDKYTMSINEGLKALKFNKRRASWIMWYIAKSNLKLGNSAMAKKWLTQYVNSADSPKEARLRQSECADAFAYHYITKADEALKKGKRVQAKLILEEATKLPQNKQTAYIHGKLAYVFLRLGSTDGTIREALVANSIDPKDPFYMRYLAIAYSKKGDFDQAIEWYQKYAKYVDDAEERKFAAEEIRNLEDDKEKAALSTANNPDYLNEIASVKIWKQASMPIKVFIPVAEGVKGYRSNFPQLFFEALQAWRVASGNKISFKLLPKPTGADLSLEWTENTIAREEKGRMRGDNQGISRSSAIDDGKGRYPIITESKISIRTVDSYNQHPLSDDELKAVCLHEIGHSLGLGGHSRNNRDIMYFSECSVIPSLTKRDKATIKKLYQDYPPVYSSTDSLKVN